MAALYGFAYAEPALIYLERLVQRKIRRQIIAKIESLAKDPHPNGAKQLQNVTDGGQPVYRIRSGDYRILYSIRDGQTIVVLDIGDRKDVYRERG